MQDGTRERLLQAAGETFAELGYAQASLRKICERAGANVALVKYHFGDKEALYAAVLQALLREQAPREAIWEALDRDAAPEEILTDIIAIRLRAALQGERPGWHTRMLAHELAHPTPAFTAIRTRTFAPFYARLCTLIGRILELSPDHEETRLCTHSVMGQVMFYALSCNAHESLWALELSPERIARHVADFSLTALRERRRQLTGELV